MKYLFKLYITSNTPNSLQALNNLKKICSEQLTDQHEIQVIDILENPLAAEKDKIVAIPTLVKELPPPLKKIIGDLSDTEEVLKKLNLSTAIET